MHQAILAAAEGARDLARDLESIGSYSLAERARAVEQQLILSLEAQEFQGLEVELGAVRTMAERSSLLLRHAGAQGRILELVAHDARSAAERLRRRGIAPVIGPEDWDTFHGLFVHPQTRGIAEDLAEMLDPGA